MIEPRITAKIVYVTGTKPHPLDFDLVDQFTRTHSRKIFNLFLIYQMIESMLFMKLYFPKKII
ncbi:MAG TPA: hypothetical protein DCX45_12730 [Acinetobacter junii]|nr:hypothetical protein [Acinetobacter junii]